MVAADRSLTIPNQKGTIMKKPAKSQTFGQKVIDFYGDFSVPKRLFPSKVKVLNPHANPETHDLMAEFYGKFFSDARKRIFIFGINPGRFGGGNTGVQFTDPVALEEKCGIKNKLAKKRETSSRFIYDAIDLWGGARKFYKSFFLTAVFPLGLVRDGLNFNYYDDPKFLPKIKLLIVESMKQQIEFGADPRSVIVLGTGKNLKVFRSINDEHGFFSHVYALEHPRFIMQYRKKQLKKYLKKYQAAFLKAISAD